MNLVENILDVYEIFCFIVIQYVLGLLGKMDHDSEWNCQMDCSGVSLVVEFDFIFTIDELIQSIARSLGQLILLGVAEHLELELHTTGKRLQLLLVEQVYLEIFLPKHCLQDS